jgi:hypothetical protein
MSLRKTFKTDKNAEINGVEVVVGMNEYNNQPIYATFTRMTRTNKNYTSALEKATQPHQAAIQNETLDEGVASNMMREVFVDTILLGFRNLPKSDLTGRDEDNEVELEFTRENALALFEELPDLYADWEKRANRAATFREAQREKNAKN